MPRVGKYDGRAIEEALAGPTLFQDGVHLQGAVVDATYASREPPLLKRLREESVAFLTDLQCLRFSTPTFLDVEPVASLSYAPAEPLNPESSAPALRQVARTALAFQQGIGARRYVAPALPVFDERSGDWHLTNRRLLAAAVEANGGREVDRQPLFALVAPGRRALAEPETFREWLLDFPISGVYVQPLNLKPRRDSLEKLAQYVRFLGVLKNSGLTVIAGRVDALGLLLQALDVVDAFDSGLGDAEAYSFAQVVRPRPRRTEGSEQRSSTGGRDRRIYLEALKTTLPSRLANEILEQPGLRHRFTCALGCCRNRGFEGLRQHPRPHYLWTRDHEVHALRTRPTREMRVQYVYERLCDAREHARVVCRSFVARGLPAPDFGHLDRWIGVLARESGVTQAA